MYSSTAAYLVSCTLFSLTIGDSYGRPGVEFKVAPVDMESAITEIFSFGNLVSCYNVLLFSCFVFLSIDLKNYRNRNMCLE